MKEGPDIITPSDLVNLREARISLGRIARRAQAAAHDAGTTIEAVRVNRPSGADYGRVLALAEVASDAVFDVVNTLDAHGMGEIDISDHIRIGSAVESDA